jgi:hypothetical protein
MLAYCHLAIQEPFFGLLAGPCRGPGDNPGISGHDGAPRRPSRRRAGTAPWSGGGARWRAPRGGGAARGDCPAPGNRAFPAFLAAIFGPARVRYSEKRSRRRSVWGNGRDFRTIFVIKSEVDTRCTLDVFFRGHVNIPYGGLEGPSPPPDPPSGSSPWAASAPHHRQAAGRRTPLRNRFHPPRAAPGGFGPPGGAPWTAPRLGAARRRNRRLLKWPKRAFPTACRRRPS